MADPRFFTRAGPFRLKEIASEIGAELGERSDPELQLIDVGPLDVADAGTLSFLDNQKYVAAFQASAAAACVVADKFVDKAPEGMALLVSNEPYKAFARAATAHAWADSSPEPVDGAAAAMADAFSSSHTAASGPQ